MIGRRALTVEVWTAGGLTRFAVLFVIDLATRRVEIAGILPEPDSAWVLQCGRQLTDPVDGPSSGCWTLRRPASEGSHRTIEAALLVAVRRRADLLAGPT
jgi:hypothetical protein